MNLLLCDGGDATTIANSYCEVEMAVLKSALNYSNGEYIYAKI